MLRGFISYAREDEGMLLGLQKQLKALERAGTIHFWCDSKINAGQFWQDEILKALDAAHVALFLISSNMIWSEFIWEKELPRACVRATEGHLLMIPVILEPCLWTAPAETCLAQLQAVPNNAIPVSRHSTLNEGFYDATARIATQIRHRFPEGELHV